MTDAPLILLVEDDVEESSITSLVLRNAGFRVMEASSGEEAIEKLRSVRPCCILLDLVLPDMSGLEFGEYLAGSVDLEDIPVITITGFPDAAPPEHAMLQFQKPFESENLIHYIRAFCIERAD